MRAKRSRLSSSQYCRVSSADFKTSLYSVPASVWCASILPFSGNYPQAKKPGFLDNLNWDTKYPERNLVSGNYPQAKKPGFFDNLNWDTKYLERNLVSGNYPQTNIINLKLFVN